jgi:esterase/lipase
MNEASNHSMADTGKPVPILMLHGLTGNISQFESLKTYLESESILCFSPHITGHRKTLPLAHEVLYHNIELELSGYLTYLKTSPDQKVVVIGQSMGALLTIILAAKHPQDIQGIILLSPGLLLDNAIQQNFNAILSHVPQSITKRLGSIKKKWVSKSHKDSKEAYPLTLLKHLGTLQKEAMRVLPELRTHITILQNTKDYHLKADVPEIIKQRAKNCTVKIFKEDWGKHHSLAGLPDVQKVVLQTYQSLGVYPTALNLS